MAEDFNEQIIQEFRANEGRVGGMFEGAPLVLLTTVGARSGVAKTNPAVYLRDGERILVFGSNAGQDRHPAWYHNLVANPEVVVELGAERFGAHAVPLTGGERDRMYERQASLDPAFAAYQAGTSRVIPVVALHRSTEPGKTGTGETGTEETGTEETGTEETGTEETGTEETGTEETGTEETGTEETGTEKTGTEETWTEKTQTEESGIEMTGAVGERVRAFGDELVRVHGWLRAELAKVRKGAGGGRGLGEELRAHCLTFCEALHFHHGAEDGVAFPYLEETHPELAQALDRLRREHVVVARLTGELRALLDRDDVGDAAERGGYVSGTAERDSDVNDTAERGSAVSGTAERGGDVGDAIERLAAALEAHFDYEEEQLVPVLNRLTSVPWGAPGGVA
ncbi:nitroreductase/quinone reductase family protein [Nonomuraea mangrovi]|uniref:Nitroreductase/quinone reductase family protein n=1 Tax=Nonomuraea mangrovi TaxID=2316207 RepID=A0ABW4SZW8_9ACTN